MSDFGVLFKKGDGERSSVSGVVKLLVRSTGYKPEQISPQVAETKGGKAFKVWFQVLDGIHKGAIIQDTMNYENISPVAQNIGKAKLLEFAKALGLAGIEDLNITPIVSLVGKIITAEIYTEPARGEYAAKDTVKKYIPANMGKPDLTAPELKNEMPDF